MVDSYGIRRVPGELDSGYQQMLDPSSDLFKNNFSRDKWCKTFPELTKVSLDFSRLSFPYCSFISLVFGSPELKDLKIASIEKICEFDIQDFKNRTRKLQLKLRNICLETKEICGKTLILFWRNRDSLREHKKKKTIIPFESLIDLLDVCPFLKTIFVNLTAEERQTLVQKYDLVEFKKPAAVLNEFEHLDQY